jgi:acyl carrier protein
MELNEFVQLFAEQFEETPATEFTKDTKFRDLDEWSSLLALSIIAMVDDEFDVSLNAEDMKKSQTVEDVYNAVQAKL